jgi:hypothetical protein
MRKQLAQRRIKFILQFQVLVIDLSIFRNILCILMQRPIYSIALIA